MLSAASQRCCPRRVSTWRKRSSIPLLITHGVPRISHSAFCQRRRESVSSFISPRRAWIRRWLRTQSKTTTDSKQPEVLVVDTRDGKVLEKIAAPESLAVLFNPARNEAYVTHRKAGEVSVIDGKSYKVVKTFKTPTHPNSLALSEDGKTLYVSVKQASSREKEATAPDDVIRIAL